jgi:hypothetical protein
MPLELQIPSYIGWKGIHHLLFLLTLTIRG